MIAKTRRRPAQAPRGQTTFSSGAYERSRSFSPLSGKRTRTRSGPSRPVTIPSPNFEWRTVSPVASSGASGFGRTAATPLARGGGAIARWNARSARRLAAVRRAARGRGRPDRRDPLVLEDVRGISARNCEGAFCMRAPNRKRLRQYVSDEAAAGAGHPDVHEAALLLEVRLLDGALVREDAVLEADAGRRRGNSRPFAVCSVISVTTPRSSCSSSSASETSESSCRKRAEIARAVVARVELARDADQLVEVLEPAPCLDRPLLAQRLAVAGVVERALEQLGDRGAVGDAASSPASMSEKAARRGARRGPAARHRPRAARPAA